MGRIARWLLVLAVLLLVAPVWADHGRHARVPVQVGRDLKAPAGGAAERYFSRLALAKIGQRVQSKDDHLNLLVIGNDRTGLWKKAFAMAPHAELAKLVRAVAADR